MSEREVKHFFNKELKLVYTSQNLLLTAAVGAGKETIDRAYEIAELAKHLDFINLMTYVSRDVSKYFILNTKNIFI